MLEASQTSWDSFMEFLDRFENEFKKQLTADSIERHGNGNGCSMNSIAIALFGRLPIFRWMMKTRCGRSTRPSFASSATTFWKLRWNLNSRLRKIDHATILDALQTVMTAVYQNIFSYNHSQDETIQGARNGKTKRSLRSYIVGAEDNLFACPNGAHCLCRRGAQTD